MASPEPSAARMMLREIARERSDLVGEKMKAMREEELDEIRNELFLILDGLETGRHVDEFLCLQKLVQGRVDLEPDTLIKMARPMQLEFLVAMRTGNKAFMSPITSDIPHNYIADVLLERRCANNKCLTRLPAYDCACHICATKKGFCSDCMCMICNKLQPQSGSCCWIRCDVCSHRAHMDCAIDGGQKTPGKKMLFRCKACLWTFELLGWVRKVFQECTPRWDSGDLLWELSYVYKIFHLSKDSEETKFSSICSELIGCLNSGSADESMCRRRLLEALQDRSHQKNNLEALEHICMDASADPVELPYALIECITNGFSKRIGNGGFGVVYMGVFRNKKVAVKKLYQTGHFSDKQFEDELKCLRRVKHENIVRFLGYCSDTQEKAVEYNGQFVLAEDRRRFLCFEYAPNKSLHDYLKDESQRHEWDTHYQMIKGICKGLCYLHNIERINHLDLKPENILLDADMVPKITDFGLSRRFSGEQSRIITKNIRGSLYGTRALEQRGDII
ncbi:hypothetical protein ACP4OV_002365 [Aristida adscensionis]